MTAFNLREEILREHSKAQCNQIINWVGDSQDRFDTLFKLFLEDEYRVVQRAAWPVSYCVISHPAFITKHWAKLIKNLRKPNVPEAVKRNSMRLIQEIIIPVKYEGEIMNACFNYISDPKEAVAVKAFSLRVLENLYKKYPEILPELKLLIEERMPHETAAFKSRAKKILALNK